MYLFHFKKVQTFEFFKNKRRTSECFLFDSNRSLFSYHHSHSHTESTESSGKEKQKMPKKSFKIDIGNATVV